MQGYKSDYNTVPSELLVNPRLHHFLNLTVLHDLCASVGGDFFSIYAYIVGKELQIVLYVRSEFVLAIPLLVHFQFLA